VKTAAKNVVLGSHSSANFQGGATAYTTVVASGNTIQVIITPTATGRPIFIGLTNDGTTGNDGGYVVNFPNGGSASNSSSIGIAKNGSNAIYFVCGTQAVPSSTINYIDTVGGTAGTPITYTLIYQNNQTQFGQYTEVSYSRMIAYEL